MSEDISPSVDISTLDGLTEFLRRHNVPLEKWGTGSYKTVNHLLKEIMSGESLITSKGGRVHRELSVISLDVLYKDRMLGMLILKEDRQEFKDGRAEPVRRRKRLPSSVSEKVKAGEKDLLGACGRALQEELGIHCLGLEFIEVGHRVEGPNEAYSYPGVLSTTTVHTYRVTLPREDFRLGGYVEYQADKNTYFVWHKMT